MREIIGAIVMTASLTVSQAAKADDLAQHSSEFGSPAALQAWKEHSPQGFVPKWQPPRIADGQLVLQPTSSGWFEDNQAGHLYQVVQGDFIVTTRIRVVGTDAVLPQTDFSLAGIFIRAPREVSATTWTPGRENWLFFSVGTASPAGEPHYEVKSTTNSLSTLKIIPSQAGWVELRVARHGELFTLLHKPEGATEWRVIDQMIRPDLPEILNVGLTAYADYGSVAATYPNYNLYNTLGVGAENADLIARIDWIRFRRPTTGRFPIANIDSPAIFGRDVIAARRADLLQN